HLDPGQHAEQQGQPVADHLLVVGDEHPHRRGLSAHLAGAHEAGSHSRTANPSSERPARRRPPLSAARSDIPVRPRPPDGSPTPVPSPPLSSTDTSTPPAAQASRTVTRTPRPACLATFARASCTTRYSISPASGSSGHGAPSTSSTIGMPSAAAVSETRPGRL